jgi:hypothetical protein
MHHIFICIVAQTTITSNKQIFHHHSKLTDTLRNSGISKQILYIYILISNRISIKTKGRTQVHRK